uniref:FSA_C domain-containing protein n=1 Tax=Angiostrongylus cantonensis TaxID=6313 RepID=A0A158P9G2_ANGCA
MLRILMYLQSERLGQRFDFAGNGFGSAGAVDTKSEMVTAEASIRDQKILNAIASYAVLRNSNMSDSIQNERAVVELMRFIMQQPFDFLRIFVGDSCLIMTEGQLDFSGFSVKQGWTVPVALQIYWKPVFVIIYEAKVVSELIINLLSRLSLNENPPHVELQLVAWTKFFLEPCIENRATMSTTGGGSDEDCFVMCDPEQWCSVPLGLLPGASVDNFSLIIDDEYIVSQRRAQQRNDLLLGVDIEFLPRAITYLSHLFPLKDDSISFTFGNDESTIAKELSNSSGEGEEYDAAAIDRVFWRDVATHLHTNEFKDIEQISTYHLANAAFRRTEYNKKRNFTYGINLQDRKETFNTSSEGLPNQLSSWLLHEIKYDQNKGKLNYETQFVFGVARASGGHTPVHLQSIINDDHGRLQINVVNMSYIVNSVQRQEVAGRLNFYEKFFGGLTIVCAQMVDNEPRSLGFVHNIDYFVNADDEDLFFLDSMKYEDYVTIDSSPSNLPYLNETMNIKRTNALQENF